MADPVNAADVLLGEADHIAYYEPPIPRGQWRFVARKYARRLTAALLALGDGDPVVIMTDGTLRRLVDGCREDDFHLADPVRPEEADRD